MAGILAVRAVGTAALDSRWVGVGRFDLTTVVVCKFIGLGSRVDLCGDGGGDGDRWMRRTRVCGRGWKLRVGD